MFRFWKKPDDKDNLSGALKKKGIFCSAEAAMISLAIHLILIISAGSIVAVRYVQKHNAAFVGENVERPKLERRQLQMPVKLQNLQKKSRPKVTSRMATASSSAFTLPDMAGFGQPGKSAGFVRTYGEDTAERDLSKMGSAGSLGFGVSSVNFFGARSSGEKIVFVISASTWMMEDRKGGYTTYKFVKDRIHQMVSGMNAATLFNVVVYNERRQAAVFSPKLIPASQEAKTQLLAWLVPINSDPANVTVIPANYKTSIAYESDVANDATDWLLAVQAAMEQGADNIFVLCAGWETHGISRARQEELFGWTKEERLKKLAAAGWPQSRYDDYIEKRDALMDKGRAMLEKENKARAAKGLPPKVVKYISDYVYNELNWPRLEGPPTDTALGLIPQGRYDVENVLNHLDAVYQYNYVPKKLEKPKISFVCLVDAEGRSLAEGGETLGSEGMAFLQKVAGRYRGGFEFLRGAKTVENLLSNNPGIQQASE